MVSAGRGFGPIEHSQIPLIATSLSLRLSRLDRTQIATVSAILTYVWMPSLRLASASWLSSSLTFDHPSHHCVTINMHLIILTIHGVIVTSWFHHHPLTALALSAITLLVARTASSLLLYSDSASSLSVSFCNHDDRRDVDDKTCGDCEVNSWSWS